MPDMSALNIGDNSLQNSILNDSVNFNLDDFLGLKKQESIKAPVKGQHTQNSLNNGPARLITNFENIDQREANRSPHNQPLLSNSPILRQKTRTQLASLSSNTPLSLINEVRRLLDERGDITGEEFEAFVQNLAALVEKAEALIKLDGLSSTLKERLKTLEDKKLRLAAISFLKRR